jgi:hypothetical protein
VALLRVLFGVCASMLPESETVAVSTKGTATAAFVSHFIINEILDIGQSSC